MTSNDISDDILNICYVRNIANKKTVLYINDYTKYHSYLKSINTIVHIVTANIINSKILNYEKNSQILKSNNNVFFVDNIIKNCVEIVCISAQYEFIEFIDIGNNDIIIIYDTHTNNSIMYIIHFFIKMNKQYKLIHNNDIKLDTICKSIIYVGNLIFNNARIIKLLNNANYLVKNNDIMIIENIKNDKCDYFICDHQRFYDIYTL